MNIGEYIFVYNYLKKSSLIMVISIKNVKYEFSPVEKDKIFKYYRPFSTNSILDVESVGT